MTWTWQSDGQCCISSSHSKADAGRVPSCGSVAVPLKAIDWPTTQVSDASGAVIDAVGGELPTEIVLISVAVAFDGSVTRSPTSTLPADAYVREAVSPVASSNWVSPSRSQA